MQKPRKLPSDMNSRAAQIVAFSTGQAVPGTQTPPAVSGKNPAAVALGRLGGLKGGKARAAALSKKRREEIAQAAAKKRWSNQRKSEKPK